MQNVPKNSKTKYIAHLYYHGRLEHELNGHCIEQLRIQVYTMLETLRTGSVGKIWDTEQHKLLHSCTYQTSE